MNRSRPVLAGVFVADPEPRLLGRYCKACDRKFFPPPAVCPYCLQPISISPLSSEGTLYAYTVVRTRPPFGLPQPYAIGYVDLETDNLRIFTLLDGERIQDLRIGLPLTLRIEGMGLHRDGTPCLRYYFTPLHGGDQ